MASNLQTLAMSILAMSVLAMLKNNEYLIYWTSGIIACLLFAINVSTAVVLAHRVIDYNRYASKSFPLVQAYEGINACTKILTTDLAEMRTYIIKFKTLLDHIGTARASARQNQDRSFIVTLAGLEGYISTFVYKYTTTTELGKALLREGRELAKEAEQIRMDYINAYFGQRQGTEQLQSTLQKLIAFMSKIECFMQTLNSIDKEAAILVVL